MNLAHYLYGCYAMGDANPARTPVTAKRLRPPRRNRACIVCGRRFTPKRKTGLYCGSSCRQKAYRWRKEKGE